MQGIYAIVNSETKRTYVGSSVNIEERAQEHFRTLKLGVHHSFLLQKSFNKHGADCFSLIVLELVVNREDLEARENFWLPTGSYNVAKFAVASMRGRNHDDKTKAKIKANHKGMKGRKHTEETKKKMGDSHKGRTVDEEGRENMRKGAAKRVWTEADRERSSKTLQNPDARAKAEATRRIVRAQKAEQRAKDNPIEKKPERPRSEIGIEGRQKTNERRKNGVFTPAELQHLKNINDKNRGSKHTEETKEKMRLGHARRREALLCPP